MQLRSRIRQVGTSLVEVMVAVLVLSMGMAGVAALMVTNVTSTSSAQVYSQAVIHADQMADVMRANMMAYETAVFTTDPGTTSANCTGGTGCTLTEQAQYDYASWRAAVARDLPLGQGFICTDSDDNDDTTTITIDDGQPGA